MKGKNTVNMTKGPILSRIVLFALPLMLGQLFQMLYNTFDTWCVGNFVGKNAFSAVGTVGSICNMVIGIVNGFSTGAGVVISQYFGAGDEDKVEKATHTFIAFFIILSLLATAFGIIFTPAMVRMVGSPEEVAAEQRIYLRIYFMGVSGLLLYNMGSAIFRAVGNSRLPFIFLVISASLNIVMDLVFVIIFHMGTAGVAYATIAAQAASAVFVITALMRTQSPVRFSPGKLGIDFTILKRIVVIGLPSSVQMGIVSFSNVFVQSYINYFGTDVMGGWTAYSKIDQILFLPMQNLGLATMTFVGQNTGAGDLRRARRGAVRTLLASISTVFVLLIPVVSFAPRVVEFFIGKNEPMVVYYGTLLLRTVSPFYVFCSFNQILGSALRGAGKSHFPMFVMLFSYVAFRQVYLYVMSHYISNTFLPIAFAYPFGWILCSTIITITFLLYFGKEIRKREGKGNTVL